MTALLEVDDLRVHFGSGDGLVRAVDGVSLRVEPGETLGIVGESGSGKSVTALSLLRLVPTPPGRIAGGRIVLGGTDLLALPIERMRAIRGREVAMIFQDPMTSLNPVLTVGRQIAEVLELHLGLDRDAAMRRTIGLFEMVGIPAAATRVSDYPHHFSGGMRQRVMIAMAIACRPKMLIADEPTTALDVTIQAQILELIRSLQRELGMALIVITHDLGVVAGMADRVAVMYAGRIVEEGTSERIFGDPRMPYTIGLLQSVPRADARGQRRLTPIAGAPPEPHGETKSCRFAPRCAHAEAACRSTVPALRNVDTAHRAACLRDIHSPWARPA
jgi:oligopeptide/dipeptide ABC transporter ATP-binding protein